jgi:large subunit ribosomal protein L29
VKIEEIRALDSAELNKKLQAAEQELFNLRIKLSTKQLVNHREIPRVKHDIARIETVIKERSLAVNQGK